MFLRSQKAIVTGSARGLGAVIAQTMWREGADLLLVDRPQSDIHELRDRLMANASGQQAAHSLAVDLSDPAAARAVLDEARRLWPRLDILVNNAGIQGPIGMIADNDWAAWRETIQINLLAPAELCKLAIAWMRETGGGRIVNLGGGGVAGLRPNFSAYATAKCGLIKFSETIAAEVAGLGIRVNCIAPGPIDTEGAAPRVWPNPKVKEMVARSRALQRFGRVEEIAYPCIFLASDASSYVTGALLIIDGGEGMRISE